MCITEQQLHIVKADNNSDGTEILFDNISCFNTCPSSIKEVTKGFAVHLNEKCDGTCSKAKVSQCLSNPTMLCLPKIFIQFYRDFNRSRIKDLSMAMFPERFWSGVLAMK